jgi:outer membrane protein TolC
MRFKQELGLAPAAEVALTGGIAAPGGALPQGDLVSRYLSGRFDIQTLVKEREILKNTRGKSALEEFAPDLSLSYSYSPSLQTPWSGGWETRSSLGLSVSIPLDAWWPASASRMKLRKVEDDLAANALELAAQTLEAEIEIRSLVLEVENARRSMEVAEKNLALARRVYDLTEQEYNAGVSEFLNLQEADDDLRAAELELLTASYDIRIDLLNLEYALNTRFADLKQ